MRCDGRDGGRRETATRASHRASVGRSVDRASDRRSVVVGLARVVVAVARRDGRTDDPVVVSVEAAPARDPRVASCIVDASLSGSVSVRDARG